MNKIELNEKQKAVVKKYLDGDYSPFFASEEEQKAMNEVIDAASKLEDELDAYDESGEDLVKWYFEKYQEQDKEI
ncbi:MAG TPA: hypothetical protein DDW85_02340 [Porphyromonadaceae bacterium]|nr:hypothetical protein [Porphyromonadaceae bacterium]